MMVIQTVLQPLSKRDFKEVMLEISFKNETFYFQTGVFLCVKDFNLIKGGVSCNESPKRSILLRLAEQEILRHKFILSNVLETSQTNSLAEIRADYNKRKASMTLFQLFQRVIAKKRKQGCIATADSYASTLSCFQKLLNYRDCTLESISKSCIKNWIEKIKKQNISHNTATFYLRNLRSLLIIYAQKDKFSNYFQEHHFKQNKTKKRALDTEEIKVLLNCEVSSMPKLQKAKDLFIMSLLLRGMPLIDLVYLKKTNLSGEYIYYARHKTGVSLQVKILPYVAALFAKYKTTAQSPYVLDILSEDESNQTNFKRYRNFLRSHNRNLNILGNFLHLSIPLSSYVSRHTWATQAKYIGTTVTLISESLGHSSEEVTYSYLKDFECSQLDEVNEKVYKNIVLSMQNL